MIRSARPTVLSVVITISLQNCFFLHDFEKCGRTCIRTIWVKQWSLPAVWINIASAWQLLFTGFIFPHKISYFMEESLSDELIKSYRDDLDFQNLIDLVQFEFQCCGISSQGYRYDYLMCWVIWTWNLILKNIFLCRDWSKNEYFNCTRPEENKSVERCGVPFSCCLSGGMTESGIRKKVVANANMWYLKRTIKF